MFHSIFEKIAQTTLENKTIRRKLCVVCKLNRATSTNLGNAACDFCGTLFSFVAIALCNKGQLKTCSKFPHPMEMPPATWMKPLCNFGVDCLCCLFSRALCSGLKIENVTFPPEVKSEKADEVNDERVLLRVEYVDGTIVLRSLNKTILPGITGRFLLEAEIHFPSDEVLDESRQPMETENGGFQESSEDPQVADFDRDHAMRHSFTNSPLLEGQITSDGVDEATVKQPQVICQRNCLRYGLLPLVTEEMIFRYATLNGPYPEIFLTQL